VGYLKLTLTPTAAKAESGLAGVHKVKTFSAADKVLKSQAESSSFKYLPSSNKSEPENHPIISEEWPARRSLRPQMICSQEISIT
jgi:hypothetical protein